jgi:hypothetical protein
LSDNFKLKLFNGVFFTKTPTKLNTTRFHTTKLYKKPLLLKTFVVVIGVLSRSFDWPFVAIIINFIK